MDRTNSKYSNRMFETGFTSSIEFCQTPMGKQKNPIVRFSSPILTHHNGVLLVNISNQSRVSSVKTTN